MTRYYAEHIPLLKGPLKKPNHSNLLRIENKRMYDSEPPPSQGNKLSEDPYRPKPLPELKIRGHELHVAHGMRWDNMPSNANVVLGSPFSATMQNPTKITILKKATEYLEETSSKYAEARQAAEALAREKEAWKTEREALAAKLEISTITTLEVTDADHRFIFVDPTWEIVLGYSREEVVRQLVHDLVDCPTCPFMRTRSEHIKTSLEQGHEWSGITVGVRKNGRAFVCETTITPVLDANKSILQYITRRRKSTCLTERGGAHV